MGASRLGAGLVIWCSDDVAMAASNSLASARRHRRRLEATDTPGQRAGWPTTSGTNSGQADDPGERNAHPNSAHFVSWAMQIGTSGAGRPPPVPSGNSLASRRLSCKPGAM